MKSFLIFSVLFSLSLAVTQEDRDKIEKVANEEIEQSERLKQEYKNDFTTKVSSIVDGKDPSCYAEDLKSIEESVMKFIDFTFDGAIKRMKGIIDFARNGYDDYDLQEMIEGIDSGKFKNVAEDALATVNEIIDHGYVLRLTQAVKKC